MGEAISITGMGIICAIGNDTPSVLDALLRKESGIGPMKYLPSVHRDIPVGEVKLSTEEMKQRLGIAIALLGKPRFLVLDEPTNGLDPAGITEMRELILKLNREQGISFFISSHILDELGRVATKFGIMNHGELVEEISSAALQEQCKKRLEIYPDDLQRASALLSERVGADALRVQEDHIVLTRGIEDSAALNKLLWENQIAVSRLELKAETLEQYFMRKVNG